MGFWLTLFLWAASFVISDYFRPRLPSQTPAGLGDFNIPTATEGRYIPVMTGTLRVNGPNCVWYGDYVVQEQTVTTGVVFRRDEVVGFTYFLALQYAQVHNEVAGITAVWIGDDLVYDGVATSVVDIDRDDLFGGAGSGGGFVGRIRLYTGRQDQAVSAFLSTRLSPLPAYRGTAYIMITDIAETGGANIGESNQMREVRVELQAFDTVANGALGDVLGLGNDHHFIGADINPISYAYEVFTNTDWGGAFAPAEFNLANFRTVAETIFSEGLGFSRLYDDVLDAEDIIDEIEQHIDGYIGPNPLTGQIEVIIIRNDYVLANEFQANASNILSVPKWSKSDWSQTVNEIHLQYADRAKSYKDTFAKAQSLANRVIQGRAKPDDLRFPGVHVNSVANQIVWRSARSRFRAMTSGTVELDRSGFELRPGSVLSFTDADVEETNLPCRVTSIGKGEINDLAISVEVVEDVFGIETVGTVAPPASGFVPPIQAVIALDAVDQAATESPAIITKLDAVLPNTGPRLLCFARLTGGNPTSYEVIRRTRSFGVGAYGSFESSEFITAGFMDVGVLRNAEVAWVPGNGTLTMQVDPISGSLDSLIGVYAPGPGSALGIAVIEPGTANEEWVAFTSIVDDGTGIRLEGLWRAATDSPMAAHIATSRIWFVWTGGLGLPIETYSEGAGVQAKFLPTAPSASILEAGAAALAEVEMHLTERRTRPLMPRRVDINTAEFPAGDVNWNQLAQLGPDVIGVSIVSYFRLWAVDAIVDSIAGLNAGGGAIEASDILSQDMQISMWIYNLDTHPTPGRGNAILSVVNMPVIDATFTQLFSQNQAISAGISADFESRLEIEVSHQPATLSGGRKVSIDPLFFDFSSIGDWIELLVPYSEVAFHSHFDGVDAATTAIDESDQAATITFVGNAQIDTAQSVFGGASLLLDGVGDYVTVPDHAAFNLSNNNFTFQHRVRFGADPSSSAMMFASKWTETGNQRSFRAGFDNNTLIFQISTNGTDVVQGLQQVWNPDGNTTYAIEFVRNGNTMRVFVDGVRVGVDDTTIGANSVFDSTAIVWFGATDAAANDYLNGWQDEVRIINGSALHALEFTPDADEFWFHRVAFQTDFEGADAVTTLMSQDRFLQTLTFVGNAQLDTDQSRFAGSSLLLDGSGDRVTAPDIAAYDFAAGDFTAEVFARFATVSGNQYLISHWGASGQFGWALGRSSGGNLVVDYSTTGSDSFLASGSWTPVADTWYHVAACRDGANLRLFVDGVQIGSTHDIGALVVFDSTAVLEIGAQNGANFFDGHVANSRVTQGKALYTEDFTPPAIPFSKL